MIVFETTALICLIMTAAIWAYLSGRLKKTLTKPREDLILKTDKWTPRLNFAASILFLISSIVHVIVRIIILGQTLIK